MARQTKREMPVPVTKPEPVDVFGPIDRAFDRVFGTWLTTMPFRRPMATARQFFGDAFIPVDEFEKDGMLVVRAELPGMDPESDVELTVSNGVLHIVARRRGEEDVHDEHYVRKEMRYGSFERSLPLPEGVTETDIKATYKDGILEVTIPEGKRPVATKIAVSHS